MTAATRKEVLSRIAAAAKRTVAKEGVTLEEAVSRHVKAVVAQWPEVALLVALRR